MGPWIDASRGERQAVLHEEINRLPGVYRTVVVLCGLEGRPIEQAARDLRWPVGVLERRLARALDDLRVRLSRSYYGIPAGIWDSGILQDLGAVVPERLIESHRRGGNPPPRPTGRPGVSLTGSGNPGGTVSHRSLVIADPRL